MGEWRKKELHHQIDGFWFICEFFKKTFDLSMTVKDSWNIFGGFGEVDWNWPCHDFPDRVMQFFDFDNFLKVNYSVYVQKTQLRAFYCQSYQKSIFLPTSEIQIQSNEFSTKKKYRTQSYLYSFVSFFVLSLCLVHTLLFISHHFCTLFRLDYCSYI